MSKVCQLSGRRSIVGNHVSHSNQKTKRRFEPNLKKRRFYIPETDQWVTLKVSMYALRTINKKGLYAYLKEQEAKGIDTGVQLGEPNKIQW